MWTKAQRERHDRLSGCYPSSLTDAEWAGLERLIPPARPGGRPRETDMRAAMDALFHLLLPVALPATRRALPAAQHGLRHLPWLAA